MDVEFADDLLENRPHPKPPGASEMLRLIAYDIASPRRLQRVGQACSDFGVRIQKSLFECWLEDREFHLLWDRLGSLTDPSEDRLVAYTLDAGAARKRLRMGEQMQLTDRKDRYLF